MPNSAQVNSVGDTPTRISEQPVMPSPAALAAEVADHATDERARWRAELHKRIDYTAQRLKAIEAERANAIAAWDVAERNVRLELESCEVARQVLDAADQAPATVPSRG